MTGPSDPTEPTPTQTGDASQPSAPTPPSDASQPSAPTWFGSTTQTPPPGPVVHEVPLAPVATIRSPSRKRGVVDVVLVVAAIFAVGGVGFALGRITAPVTPATFAGAGGNGQLPGGGQFPGGGEFGNGGGNRGNGFGAGGGISIGGTVTDVAADHLTLKLASGQSIQIALNSSTAYHSQAPATVSDVTAGSTVQVQLTRGAGANGGGNGGTGGLTLGAASSVTVIPK
jgi:hypothetical protein